MSAMKDSIVPREEWPEDLAKLLDHLVDVFKVSGSMPPTIYRYLKAPWGESGSEMYVISEMEHEGHKRQVEKLMVCMAVDPETTGVAMCSEAWSTKEAVEGMSMEEMEKFYEEWSNRSLEDMPGRLEVVTVSFQTPEFEWSAHANIVREGGGVWLGKWEVVRMNYVPLEGISTEAVHKDQKGINVSGRFVGCFHKAKKFLDRCEELGRGLTDEQRSFSIEGEEGISHYVDKTGKVFLNGRGEMDQEGLIRETVKAIKKKAALSSVMASDELIDLRNNVKQLLGVIDRDSVGEKWRNPEMLELLRESLASINRELESRHKSGR